MLKADDRSAFWGHEGLDFVDDVADDGDDDRMTIDLKAFWDILDEDDPLQNHPEGLPAGNMPQGLPDFETAASVGAELAEPVAFSSSYNSEGSDSRVGTSDFSAECVRNPSIYNFGNQEPSALAGSPASCSGSLSDWMFPASGLAAGTNSFIHLSPSDHVDETHRRIPSYVLSHGFAHEGQSHDATMEKSNFNYVNHFNSIEYAARMPDASETIETSSMDVDMHIPWYPPDGYNPQFMLNNVDVSNLTKEWEQPSARATVHSDEVFDTQVAKLGATNMGAAPIEDSSISGLNLKYEDCVSTSLGEQRLAKLDDGSKPVSQFLPHTPADMHRNEHLISVKNERGNNVVSKGMAYSSCDGTHKKFPAANGSSSGEGLGKLLPPVISSKSSKNFSACMEDEKEDFSLVSKRARQSFGTIIDSAYRKSDRVVDDRCTDVKALEQSYPQPLTSAKHLYCKKDEVVGEMTQPQSKDGCYSEVSSQTTQTTAIVNSFEVDDDPDVCILENPSEHVRSSLHVKRKPLAGYQRLTISDPLSHVGLGGAKLKANDERLVLRVALQDLSQPKTEASPPDGVLAVPLLRHQRIALSWMVQKETYSIHCSGGILADDQGLGKTISTIALILKERSPSSSILTQNYDRETYNLDEDDGCASVLGGYEQDAKSSPESSNGTRMSQIPAVHTKGRPPAGTLVVCPTSVLRQWADELHNKVTCQAKLSVLVYHGSNRTKDPCELAKYDVVLTTYSIVSMEVPKQPLVDKDDDETGRDDPRDVPFSQKRKYAPTSKKSSTKVKKESDSLLFESSARPLARVGWFRVVLDEAQSIKNYRTQVARACWGLRAKRRWCLSGTPIQNAVDDLYSYFRFLRYDPYATYKSFCSSIKVPISKNPTTGYKKLQAVLKTVMLRRTKGTLLDGKPIINLPPKFVELKKVDFTMEERDFYCHLEADSRAQFAEYAAAGTVKQNYVNILLMLLRLRQACDHPLLVKGYDSSSAWRSSVEMAKKLPREKQVGLLSCLEASLAICGICNDPPEDAVVTSCGHVFCNQCICERLTGDDNQCPSTNCKDRLSASSVFSRTALKSCLSEEPSRDGTPDSSGSEASWGPSFDSSKIKAALKVLQSLSKPKPTTNDVATLPKKSPDLAILPKKSPDPFAMEEGESNTDVENTDLVEGSNELVKVAGEKAIVFSQWTRMLDLLETGLKNSSIQYRRLDGTMSVLAREKAVNDFKTLPEVTVIIMSLKAASLGLNMVAACHVILLDLWWNPTTEDQAVDRAHRIGQTRPVSVLRLTVKDTVEDRILALQEKKREMVASAFGEDQTGGNRTRLTVEDLKYLFMA